ncbi:hypothetical protein Tco_1484518 [Tanacetum coccineum]
MWSSTRTVAPTPSSAIVQFPISDNFRIKAFTNSLMKLLLTLGSESKKCFALVMDMENSKSAPKQLFPPVEATSIPITHVDGEIGRSHNTKIDLEFLIIRKELKEMQDGRRDNHALDDYLMDDTPMCEPNEANYIQRYHGGYHDHEPINSYNAGIDANLISWIGN